MYNFTRTLSNTSRADPMMGANAKRSKSRCSRNYSLFFIYIATVVLNHGALTTGLLSSIEHVKTSSQESLTYTLVAIAAFCIGSASSYLCKREIFHFQRRHESKRSSLIWLAYQTIMCAFKVAIVTSYLLHILLAKFESWYRISVSALHIEQMLAVGVLVVVEVVYLITFLKLVMLFREYCHPRKIWKSATKLNILLRLIGEIYLVASIEAVFLCLSYPDPFTWSVPDDIDKGLTRSQAAATFFGMTAFANALLLLGLTVNEKSSSVLRRGRRVLVLFGWGSLTLIIWLTKLKQLIRCAAGVTPLTLPFPPTMTALGIFIDATDLLLMVVVFRYCSLELSKCLRRTRDRVFVVPVEQGTPNGGQPSSSTGHAANAVENYV